MKQIFLIFFCGSLLIWATTVDAEAEDGDTNTYLVEGSWGDGDMNLNMDLEDHQAFSALIGGCDAAGKHATTWANFCCKHKCTGFKFLKEGKNKSSFCFIYKDDNENKATSCGGQADPAILQVWTIKHMLGRVTEKILRHFRVGRGGE